LHFLLGGTCARARHENSNWSPECSTTFWDTLRYGVECCAAGGRNVYALSSPLRLGGAGDVVARPRENHARVQIRHWKVLVTRLSPEEFYGRVARGNFVNGEDVWGSMHELRNNWYRGRCRHHFKGRFTAAHFRGITDWKYLGKTFLRDSELNALGTFRGVIEVNSQATESSRGIRDTTFYRTIARRSPRSLRKTRCLGVVSPGQRSRARLVGGPDGNSSFRSERLGTFNILGNYSE
jgi:hypothetical protein